MYVDAGAFPYPQIPNPLELGNTGAAQPASKECAGLENGLEAV